MTESRRFLEILAPDDMRQIHLTALRVLEEVGLWLPHREILERLHAAGARVDFAAQRVRFPAGLVEDARRKLPPRFTWHARRPAASLDMNGYDTYFSAPDSAINIIDLAGRRRPGTPQDGADICRLCDALPNLHGASTGVHPPDLTGPALDAWITLTMYTQSSKAAFGPSRSRASSLVVLRMAEVVGQSCGLPAGQWPLLAVTNTVSPLYNTPDEMDGMLEYIKRGVPLLISPELQAGASGPATLAGVLAQASAEFLAHVVIAQAFWPGLPLMLGCVSNIFDMRKMIPPYGSPEADLLCIATAQMARFYGVPSRGTGGSTDANALGMQAGAESLMSNLMCLLAGVTYVAHAAGEMENTLAVSYEKILVDEEIIGMARRLARGIGVTPETLSFETIQAVGPRGSFLDQPHTLRHFRNEQFMPALFDRDKYDIWQAAGGRRAEERAHERYQRLLREHQPAPLPADAERELRAIYAAALNGRL